MLTSAMTTRFGRRVQGWSIHSPQTRSKNLPHTFSGDDLLAKTPGVTISKAPVLMDDLVELRQVLYRPKLDRPVAFVGGIEIAPVFAHLLPRCTVLAAEVAIAEVIPAKLSRPILDWLVANQFLERRASSPGKD